MVLIISQKINSPGKLLLRKTKAAMESRNSTPAVALTAIRALFMNQRTMSVRWKAGGSFPGTVHQRLGSFLLPSEAKG